MKQFYPFRFVVFALYFSIFICGCEEEPTKPVARPPEAVTNLHIEESSDDRISFAWTVPDGDSMTGNRSDVEFHYGAGDLDDATWETMTETFTRSIYGATGADVHVSIGQLQHDTQYAFAMRTKDEVGLWSGVSNIIAGETTCELNIYSPGSGYSVCEDDTLIVKWHQQECHGESVRVELLLDGERVRGLGYGRDGEFKWASRPEEGRISGYQVRLRDSTSGEVSETNEFNITPGCVFTLTYPVGGEYLCENMLSEITWDRSTCCGYHLKLVLLHDGQEVETIAEDIYSYNYYQWYPRQWEFFTHGYSIQVEDLDTGGIGVSDYTFSINLPTEPLVTIPNGGERFYDDQEVEITWIPAECRNNHVTLELWQGDEFCSQIARNVPNDGFYSWTVASCSPDSTGYKIRVVDGELDDSSDQSFTIVRECKLELSYPTGGENYCNEIPMEIRWDATKWCGDTVNIDLSQHSIICTSIAVETENDGSFDWVAEQFEGLTWGYKIVISDPETGVTANTEPAFTIQDLCPMVVSQPNGGEYLEAGKGTHISWTRPVCCTINETILLLQHGTVCDTIPHLHGQQHGSVWWIASACSEDPDGYSIRVVSAQGNYWADCEPFSISQECWMVVSGLEPNYCTGSLVPVRWTTGNCGDSIKLELLLDGQVCQVIAEEVLDSGRFDWSAQQCGSNIEGYQIRVTDLGSGMSVDTEGTFTITSSVIHLSADGLGDFPSLEAALEIVCPGDTIVLADGIYTGQENFSVEIANGVTVRSGSGDPSLCIIDGEFSSGSLFLRQGTLEGVTITRMVGTGVTVWGSYTPLINNCIFKNNRGSIGGALRCNSGGNPTVNNCLFLINQSDRGGAVGSYYGGGTFTNCTFYGNSSGNGSAFNAYNDTEFILRNCLLISNVSSDVVRCQYGGSFILECCDIFGHQTNYPLCISEFSGVQGNISLDPDFCSASLGDYHLQEGSPCLPNGNSCEIQIGAYGECMP